MISKKELKTQIELMKFSSGARDLRYDYDYVRVMDKISNNKGDIAKLIEELKDVKREVDNIRQNVADDQNWIFNANKEFEELKRQLNDLRVAYNHNVPTLVSDVRSLDGGNQYKFYRLKGKVVIDESYVTWEVRRIESAQLVPDKSPKFFTRGLHVSKTSNGVEQYFVVAHDFDDAIKIVNTAFPNRVYWA